MQPASDARTRTLDACFLGPYGENDALLEKLVVEFLRDHVYWRRNFHPEDPPAISTTAAQHPDYQAFEARMRRELYQLSTALKKTAIRPSRRARARAVGAGKLRNGGGRGIMGA